MRIYFEGNTDPLAKRVLVFSLSLATWWLTEKFVRPSSGAFIQSLRSIFGGSAFIGHLFSQSLPVDLVCFFLLCLLCYLKILPPPQFNLNLNKIFKEGSLWALGISAITIPLALYLGFHLGFSINWQSILGNIISNTYEEMTYRVFLFSVSAYVFKNTGAGIIMSAILFAAVHTQYPLLLQIDVGLAAIFFSLAYLRTNSLFTALWAHQLSDMILDSILLH
tara:strand:- start:6005 stop:6667 length:663 start_codon:yes stop_codon:yes gene_type:complete